MSTRMQQRRGTASQWTIANPILAEGEFGWESDTNSFKVGDGVNLWASLEYFFDETSLAASLVDYIELTSIGVADGVASLGSDGKLTSTEIPDSLATTTYVDTAVSDLVDAAPGVLDTLNELAAALGNDENFSTTLTTAVSANTADILTNTNALASLEVADITDLTATAAELNILDGVTATSAEINILDGVTADATELNYVDGVTSGIQSQLDDKALLTPAVNAKTAAYTLVVGDRGEFITADGTFTITAPSATFSAGDRIDFVNIGTGVITFAGSGVTVNSKDAALTLATQWTAATLLFLSSTSAVLIGDIE